jgi:geranylgeranyl diphosphate synthase type II
MALLKPAPVEGQHPPARPRHRVRIFEETERMAWESTEGQALELGWKRGQSHRRDR